jgi:hypothetical protein
LKEYEKMKDFFIKLFENAGYKKVSINLPTDFIVSPKVEF